MSITLELTEMQIHELVDSDTIDYYAMGKKQDIVEVNRELFKGGKEFLYKEYYFAFMSVKEGDVSLTFLQPYRANVSRHQWKYKFGCQDENGVLYWFFRGKSKATDRNVAIKIWKELVMYCQPLNLKPFIIKR